MSDKKIKVTRAQVMLAQAHVAAAKRLGIKPRAGAEKIANARRATPSVPGAQPRPRT